MSGCVETKHAKVVFEIGRTGYVDVPISNSVEDVYPGFADRGGGYHKGDTVLGG